MSYTQRSYGYIVVLKNPFTKKQRDDLMEEFWEKGIDSKIGLTYDGNCVYYDFGQDTDERDIYVDFNTFVFKIVEKRVRVLGNDERFLQIKLEPISEDEQRSNN